MENYLEYPSFLHKFKRAWDPGEHVTIAGPTGSGKSWLASDIISLRKYVLALVSKRKDRTIDERYKEFHRLKKFEPEFYQTKILLWEKPKALGDFSNQQRVFYDALSVAWKKSAWNIYLDDLFYLSETLRFKRAIQMLYTNVRSEDISLIGSIQRPAWIPREVISQSSHLLFLKMRSKMDVAKIADGTGYDTKDIEKINATLSNHDFAWLGPHGPIIVKRD